MSAGNERCVRETCLQAGMDAFLDEECSSEEFIEALLAHSRKFPLADY
jgi:hypothetical protein